MPRHGRDQIGLRVHARHFINFFVSWAQRKTVKSKLNPATTPEQNFSNFEIALRKILVVSKDEYGEREKQYQAERANKPKRGPKPRHSPKT
jgi:hypothetical protein